MGGVSRFLAERGEPARPTLEDAIELAVEALTGLLMARFRLSRTEAFLLVSARGDVRIGQCARIPGLDATAYAVFPNGAERLDDH